MLVCVGAGAANGGCVFQRGRDIGELWFQRAVVAVGRGGGYRGGWRLRHGDGGREGKLGLGFWLCEERQGDKVSFHEWLF